MKPKGYNDVQEIEWQQRDMSNKQGDKRKNIEKQYYVETPDDHVRLKKRVVNWQLTMVGN